MEMETISSWLNDDDDMEVVVVMVKVIDMNEGNLYRIKIKNN